MLTDFDETLGADFHTLIALSGAALPTVIPIRREGMRGDEVAVLIGDIRGRVSDTIARGALITVTEWTLRVRHIPIRRGT